MDRQRCFSVGFIIFFFSLILSFLSFVISSGLVDDPVVGTNNLIQYLDSESWIVTNNANITIEATVPGELITDLQVSGIIGDPYYETNWLQPVWDTGNFTYIRTFDIDPSLLPYKDSLYIVFDSLKMAGDVILNGQYIISPFNDEFLRYISPVGSLLQATNNTLQVVFTTSSDIRNIEGRWAQCSGGWDWSPYSNTEFMGSHTFSKGILKSVYLVPIPTAGIKHIVPQIMYTSSYPTSPLQDGNNGCFNVTVNVVLEIPVTPVSTTGTVTVLGSWMSTPASVPVTIPQNQPGEIVIPVTLLAACNVNLWWPLGMGKQTLYTLNVSFTSPSSLPAYGTRSIGFRTAYLVTDDDSNPFRLQNVEGTGNLTMRFRINGANFLSRGSNMIPMHEMEGRQTSEAFIALLHSAAQGNHNTLRVWGGGLYLNNVFYDTADSLGIILFHDLMYGTPWNGGSVGQPTDTPTQTAEIIHSIRRLSHHPCIALWTGGNENIGRWDNTTVNFLMPTITKVDMSRVVWPTSPSPGLLTGVHRLTGLPNGNPFTMTDKFSGNEFETHGPYQHGAGWKTVNGQPGLNPFPSNLPPQLLASNTPYGTTVAGVFASEFGCSAFSSFESMAPTLAPEHWSAHSDPMYQRNYPTDNIISVYFGNTTMNTYLPATGEFPFRATTYLAMLGSALQQKSDIEVRRSRNSWGIITWQLGEIWPCGGWGSLETTAVYDFSNPDSQKFKSLFTPGQVLGGRWKPLHHFMRSHLYKDVVLLCSDDARCVLKNDNALQGFTGTWSTSFVRLRDGLITVIGTGSANLPVGGNAAQWVCADGKNNNPCNDYSSLLPQGGCATDGSDCLLWITVTDSTTSQIVDEHAVHIVPPGEMTIPTVSVTSQVNPQRNPDGSIDVTVSTSGGVALWVTLTTLEQGYFSDNTFILLPSAPKTVQFLPIIGANLPDPSYLTTTLHIDHVSMYLSALSKR